MWMKAKTPNSILWLNYWHRGVLGALKKLFYCFYVFGLFSCFNVTAEGLW
jgi:hypothetical protein